MAWNEYLVNLTLVQLAITLVGGFMLLVCLARLLGRRDSFRVVREQKVLGPLILLAAAVLSNFAEPISELPVLSWWYQAFNRLQAAVVAGESMKSWQDVSFFYLWIQHRNFEEVTHTICALLSLIFVVMMAVFLRRTTGYLNRSLRITCGILFVFQILGYGAILHGNL